MKRVKFDKKINKYLKCFYVYITFTYISHLTDRDYNNLWLLQIDIEQQEMVTFNNPIPTHSSKEIVKTD
jgi:hypothetical protein